MMILLLFQQTDVLCVAKKVLFEVIRKDWHEYHVGYAKKRCQRLLPYLDKSGWEQIISGSHPKCFDDLFGERMI